jgi:cytochrome b involved in lipid metabolism
VGVVAIVVAVIAMGLTVVVGHTGAAAVWASRSLDTESTEDTPQTGATTAPSTGASGSAAASGPTYTLADVAGHATAADCWSVVSGGVYNLTDWIPQHPGGSGVIEAMCGIDGTASYDGQHKGQASPAKALAAYEIGTLGAASAAGTQSSAAAVASPAAPTASPAAGSITISDVAKHSTATDCWSAVSGGVYDLTAWIPQHPGGSGVIEAMCGSDGTAAYNSQHKGQSTPNKVLAGFQIGTLG